MQVSVLIYKSWLILGALFYSFLLITQVMTQIYSAMSGLMLTNALDCILFLWDRCCLLVHSLLTLDWLQHSIMLSLMLNKKVYYEYNILRADVQLRSNMLAITCAGYTVYRAEMRVLQSLMTMLSKNGKNMLHTLTLNCILTVSTFDTHFAQD